MGKSAIDRKIIRVGNSYGVVIPKEWVVSQARIRNVKPEDLKVEVIIGDNVLIRVIDSK